MPILLLVTLVAAVATAIGAIGIAAAASGEGPVTVKVGELD